MVCLTWDLNPVKWSVSQSHPITFSSNLLTHIATKEIPLSCIKQRTRFASSPSLHHHILSLFSVFLSFFLSFSLSFSFFLSLSIKNLLLSFYLLYPYDCLFAVSLLLLTTFTYLSFSIYFFLPVTLSLCIYFHLSTLPLFSSLSSSLLYLPTYLSTYVRTYQPTYLPTTFDLSNSSIFMYSLSFLTQHFSLCLCSCLCRYHLLQCGFLRPLRRRFDVFFIWSPWNCCPHPSSLASRVQLQ